MESPKLVQEDPSSPSIKLDLGAFGGETNGSSGPTSSPPISAEEPQVPPSAPAEVEREDVTLAFDTMGLNLHSESAIPPPKPSSSPKIGRAHV